MRSFLFSVLLTLPTLAPLAQASPGAVQSVVIVSAAEPAHAFVALPPEALDHLSGEISVPNTALTALAATGGYLVGGALGYGIVAAIDPSDNNVVDDLAISEAGLFYGIAVGGTLGSALAAHVVSSPDDPVWRTILVPLAAQGLVFGAAHLFFSEPDGTMALGAPPVAIVFSTSIALWD